MKRIFCAAGIACLIFSASADAADGRLPPMDQAATQDHLPDTVTPDGIHIGSWSAAHPDAGRNARAPQAASAPQPQDHLPDTVLEDGNHVGSWSASGSAAATPATGPSAAAAHAPANALGDDMQSHSMTVTPMSSCYDQLTPAEVADVKKNFLHPYAECQSRLEAKEEGKKELKQGEIQKSLTPDSPRNYIRVQAPEHPAAGMPDSPAKSGVTTNP